MTKISSAALRYTCFRVFLKFAFLVFISGSGYTIVSAQTSVTLATLADAYVRNGTYASTNFGSDVSLIVKGTTTTSYARSSYLKFSLSTLTNVNSAKLRIYGRNIENTTSITLSAFGIDNDSWAENTITFNNAPTTLAAALNTVGVTGVAQYYEIDVTNYVKTQFAGDKVVSLLIKDASNQNRALSFNSKENSLNPPQLLIGTDAPGVISVSPSKIYDNDVSGGSQGLNRVITISNTGLGNLSVSNISLTGINTDQFVLSGLPVFPATINAGGSTSFNVAFNPSSTGLKTASVNIESNDPSNSSVLVPFRGLGTTGLGGSNEPSLQAILNLREIPVGVGDDDASTNVINSSTTLQKAALLGEEVSIQKFEKAGIGNVTIEPLAVFGPTTNNPIVGVGWYNSGNAASKNELFTVSNNPVSNGQTVNANFVGTLSFDPLAASFGFYSRWPFFSDRHLYSEDNLNTFTGSIPHHVRVYPYKDQSGVVPNAYIIAFEEHTTGFDYQDVVFVVRNVKPAGETPYVTVLPLADAFVRNGTYGGINYGSDVSLIVKGTTTTSFARSSYLKFSLGSLNTINSAKLRIYGRNIENTSTITLSAFGIDNDSWAENTITFNNAPTSSAPAVNSVDVTNLAQYYEIDVTDYVTTEFGGDKVVSFLIKDADNQNRTLTFNSKENSQNPPQLVIERSGGGGTTQNNNLLFVENLDKFPSNDLFVFSKLQIPWNRDSGVYNSNHDSLTVRIHNKGINNLVIQSLSLSNAAWKFVKLKGVDYAASLLPFTLTSGTFADLTVQFIAVDQGTRTKLLKDTLKIVSNDDKFPTKFVYFNGLWQLKGEGNNEPFAKEIITSFGYKTFVGFNHTDPDKGNPLTPKGDEIIPSYFVRADPSLPVSIRQMGAYHGCCNANETIRWHAKGSATLIAIVSHIARDGQTLLPRRATPNLPAEGSFNPTTAFGFKIGGKDWTDATKNPGGLIGIRIWKAIDAKGKLIPNSYIIANDYLGGDFTNYDYNDNVYLIKNVKPEIGSAYFSALSATPSALDFGEQLLQTTNTLQLDLKSLGLTYANGSSDPLLTISAVTITGENKSEFSTTMPVKTTLNPQEATTLTVTFKPVSQGLKIADLLIHYNNSLTPHRVPLYGIAKATGTTVTALFRINSGSSTPLTINGKTWSADNQYAFDNLEPFTNSLVTTIAGTDEDALYLREQSSNGDKKPFRYEIPVANGDYAVRLHFAEIYWGTPGGGLAGGAGSRVMSVTLENILRLANFDVSQEVGAATAIVKNFPVTVTDGKLNINFSATVNRPMVVAVEVYRFSTSAPITNAEVLDTIANNTGLIPLDRYVNTNDLNKPKVYPNPLRDNFTIEIPGNYRGKHSVQIADVYGRIFNIGETLLKRGGSTIKVDISKQFLKPGIYFLRIHSDAKKTDVIKLVVE